MVYWFLYANPSDIKFRPILYWLAYPLTYFFYVIFRGHFSGFYPYPFLNVTEIGYSGVAKSFVAICGFTVLLMFLLVLLGNKKTKIKR